jgi:hypothetical protein
LKKCPPPLLGDKLPLFGEFPDFGDLEAFGDFPDLGLVIPIEARIYFPLEITRLATTAVFCVKDGAGKVTMKSLVAATLEKVVTRGSGTSADGDEDDGDETCASR